MDSLFGLDNPHVGKDLELLTTAHDDVELAILCDILEGEKIPYLKNDRGSGGALRIISGYSMYGTDILVPKDVFEQAREVLDAYRNGEPVEDESQDGESDDDDWDDESDDGSDDKSDNDSNGDSTDRKSTANRLDAGNEDEDSSGTHNGRSEDGK